MTDDYPICFGKPAKCRKTPQCAECVYVASCAWYCDNPPPKRFARSSTGHHVSMERYQYAEEVAAVPDDAASVYDADTADDYNTRPIYTNADMQYMLEFLLREVDDYTLAVVECVLREGHTTASQVAKAFGVSREAMHRKLVDSCQQYPALREVLRGALYRCKALADADNRSNITGRRARPAKPKNSQMEFTFNG